MDGSKCSHSSGVDITMPVFFDEHLQHHVRASNLKITTQTLLLYMTTLP